MIEFILNHEQIKTDASSSLLVLDWLRKKHQRPGTKEGCKEGDCGACSVMVGELVDGVVVYKAMTSCLVPLGDLHGKHLLTIEGLNLPKGQLNPAQEEMVAEGGAQCGFCTPGFIVSMCWYLLQSKHVQPNTKGLKNAISGNLCRCTGYGSIFRALDRLVASFGEGGQNAHIWSANDRVAALVDAGMMPAYLKDVAAQLVKLETTTALVMPTQPQFIIAGGTDLYVQRGEEMPHADAHLLNQTGDFDFIRVEGNQVRLGGLTSFETFASHPQMQTMFPDIKEDMALIASLPIRERATISGNIINASPIGDMTALMLALETTLVLVNKDWESRQLPMDELYLGYKTLAKSKDEIIQEMYFDAIEPNEQTSFEKVSKRRWLDIATVNSAARIATDDDGVVTKARLTLGGVAATPLLLVQASASLVGKTITPESVRHALTIADAEISPISDVRGSAKYKRLLGRQLLAAHFHKLYPTQVPLSALFEGASFQEIQP